MKKLTNILLLPGDGIGKTVIKELLPLIKMLLPTVKIELGKIGWQCWLSEATPIPDKTWDQIRKADGILLGATTSKPQAISELPNQLKKAGLYYTSPIIQLRQKLDLYANVRRCFNVKRDINEFDVTIIRENTEGLYSGLDFNPIPDEINMVIKRQQRYVNSDLEHASVALRLQTERGLRRIFKFAFNYANKNNKKSVALADKPNVLSESGEFANKIFYEVSRQYPLINATIMNVDAVAMQLVRKPEFFDVIVCENMFGDILSDVAAGVMGGLGLAPSANIGDSYSYFEPVHGSAPQMDINMPNPSAMFLSFAMMLEHFHLMHEAEIVKQAVLETIQQEKNISYDLGGSAPCHVMANDIIMRVKDAKVN